MKSVLLDVRFALRGLARSPGFAAVAILTLALGIGANTAMFSVVDAGLIKPLAFAEPERLLRVYTAFPTMGFDNFWMSQPELLELEERSETLESLGAWQVGGAPVSGGTEPMRVRAAYCTAELLPTLGVTPQLGRWYLPEEDSPDAENVVVISTGLWQGAFGGDPQILGRSIRVDGEQRRVIGVMASGFDFPVPNVDVWVPHELNRASPRPPGNHFLSVVARLAPGATLESARAELAALAERAEQEPGENHRLHPEFHPLKAYPLHADLMGDVKKPLLLLLGAVGFVLLIACANVSNLLLARAEGRVKEVAVRAALGASRLRLARQFLTESAVLGALGGAAGVLVALWGLDAILAGMPEEVPRLHTARLDGSVLAFTALVSLATAVLFGLAPLLGVRGADLHASLKSSGQRATAGRHRQRLRRLLVIAETALAVVLLVGAGLMLKSFRTLSRQDPGFDPDRLLTAQIELPQSDYPIDIAVAGFWDDLRDRVQALPGVESVAVMSGLPPVRRLNANDCYIDGWVPQPPVENCNVDFWQLCDVAYFETMKIDLSPNYPGGRLFEYDDRAGTQLVCLVNEAMARRYWPGKNPIGSWLNTGGPQDPNRFTVVGVVRDVKQQGLDRPAGTELYYPVGQSLVSSGPQRIMNLVVRAERDPLALVSAIRGLVREVDPQLALANVRSMDRVMREALLGQRALALLLAVFAGLAVLLAGVGIYGVMSYSVAQRTNEIGIRVALGAQPVQVMRWVIGSSLVLVAIGLGIGVAGSFALSRSLQSVLYEVSSTDPMTFAAVAAGIVVIALLASYLPARRATRVDPLTALRME